MFAAKQIGIYRKHRKIGAWFKTGHREDDPNCAGVILIMSHMYPRPANKILGIFVHEQARALQRLGYRVYVMSGEPHWTDDSLSHSIKAIRNRVPPESYRWEEHQGVPLLRFPYPVNSQWLKFPAHALTYTLSALDCLAHVAEDMRFELIHAHTSYTDGSAANICGKIYNRPVVITEHTGPFSYLTTNPIVRIQTQRSVLACDSLITVSEALASSMEADIRMPPHDRIFTVPNIVDTSLFTYKSPQPKKNYTMLWVGHFSDVKRVDRLLRSLAAVDPASANLVLHLVGDGEDAGKLKALANSLGIEARVKFLGAAAREDLRNRYWEADFTVVSSDTETFSLVAIESLSCGRPVLATRCGGPEEILSDPRFGILVDRSVDGLAFGIREMIDRLSSYDGEAISEAARVRYSHGAVGRQLKSVYDPLIGKFIDAREYA